MIMTMKRTIEPPALTLKTRPRLLLGLVGDSGSGKSTLVQGIIALFGPERVTEICLDDYHRYDRASRIRLGVTALNPVCNDLPLITEHLQALKQGQPVFKPVYDHRTGTFARPEWVSPREIVIVNGLFTLYTPELANLFDLSIYLNPEPELRLAWKIRRDTTKRGYTLEQVLKEIEERRPDALAHIEPQQARADLVVSFRRPHPDAPQEPLDAHLYRRTGANISELQTWASPFLTYQKQTEGEHLKIPAGLAALKARVLEKRWQHLAGLSQPTGSSHGFYQSPEGELKQSFSLSLTQLLIAGCLLRQHDPALLVA